MSRSYRRTPMCGFTTARSEKVDKTLCNRQRRRHAKQVVASDDPESAEDIRHPRDGAGTSPRMGSCSSATTSTTSTTSA